MVIFFRLMDVKSETQGGEATCLRSHSQGRAGQALAFLLDSRRANLKVPRGTEWGAKCQPVLKRCLSTVVAERASSNPSIVCLLDRDPLCACLGTSCPAGASAVTPVHAVVCLPRVGVGGGTHWEWTVDGRRDEGRCVRGAWRCFSKLQE